MYYLKAPENVRADWTVYDGPGPEPATPIADVHGSEDIARLIASSRVLLKALQRLTHPAADDDDLTHALEVIARATGKG